MTMTDIETPPSPNAPHAEQVAYYRAMGDGSPTVIRATPLRKWARMWLVTHGERLPGRRRTRKRLTGVWHGPLGADVPRKAASFISS